jgi:hypothetical protein
VKSTRGGPGEDAALAGTQALVCAWSEKFKDTVNVKIQAKQDELFTKSSSRGYPIALRRILAIYFEIFRWKLRTCS